MAQTQAGTPHDALMQSERGDRPNIGECHLSTLAKAGSPGVEAAEVVHRMERGAVMHCTGMESGGEWYTIPEEGE